MTWTWTIPLASRPGAILMPPLLDARHLRAIVPTFRDWDGARQTVEGLLECRPRPADIVLVNDNAEPDVPAWTQHDPITLVNYPGNHGPAFARNQGVKWPTGCHFDWIYFTDTACSRDRGFFAALIEASMAMPRTTVAIAGPVQGEIRSPGETPINWYMTEEAILNPPRDEHGPQAVITANAAVSSAAFTAVGGFWEGFPTAAGEDIDLGIRLRRIGPIGWAQQADVRHEFQESTEDFYRRFVRYGAGNARLKLRHGFPSLRVEHIHAKDATLQHLAAFQVLAMQQGYDSEVANWLNAAR